MVRTRTRGAAENERSLTSVVVRCLTATLRLGMSMSLYDIYFFISHQYQVVGLLLYCY